MKIHTVTKTLYITDRDLHHLEVIAEEQDDSELRSMCKRIRKNNNYFERME